MITRQGWLVAIGSLICIIAARLLGTLELFLLGVIGFAVVGIAIAFVWMRRLRIEVAREISPPRVHAGAPSRVDLSVINRGTRRTPVLRLRDAVTGTRGANLLIGPLEPGAGAQASYRLPTERRGIVEIGPMQLVVTDPVGLARATIQGAGVSRLTVFPPVHRLASLPPSGGADPHAGLERQRTLNRGGDEFYALRQFTIGDELRRVHWPSTARHDELMVRQDELPWQGRMTVIVDNTQGRVAREALDIAATIAASVLQRAHQKGTLVRIVTADGTDSGFTSGNAQLESLLEILAVIEPRPDASLRTALDRAATQVRHGGAVTITPELDTAGFVALQRLTRNFSFVTSVLIDRSAWDPDAPDGALAASRRLLRVTRTAPFPEVWNRAMAQSLHVVSVGG
ncbi:MAG TPA: DUF58 domain-containing protein [Acidimicrobiales bacterium]|nr:DUF58 domain-containing protein [Acidimicrobiales bacterium]